MSTTIGQVGRQRERTDGPDLLDFHSPTLALASTPVKFAARNTVWIVMGLVASCLAASALFPIDKVVTASGRLVAESATTVVQPLETAIVRSIDVHEGDSVKKGQILARLDPTFATADLGALRAQVESLAAEVARLTAEAKGQDYAPGSSSPSALLQSALFAQRKSEWTFKNENYREKIDSLQAQVQRAASDYYGYAERLRVATEVESRRRELKRLQVGSQLNLLAATDSRLEVKRGLDGSAAQAAQAARDLQAMKAEQAAYNQDWLAKVGQDLTDQSRKLSDAQQNLAKADLRRDLVELRADEDAVVLSVAKVSPGSVMQSGEQLITLVPVNAPLEAEVNVAGDEVGYVHPGDPVTLKLETLPYTFHGTLNASVRVVSPDSFTAGQESSDPKRGSQPTRSPAPGTAYYRTRISLGASNLRDVPSGFRLMPGMPVVADVKAGKRTVLSYLLYRVMPAFENGMREP